ncbi:hypothetical protein DPB93_16410 [Salmonella enterica subsp. salamae]|nr:hypothetical protein [Salmonella enterica subsp. salamae]
MKKNNKNGHYHPEVLPIFTHPFTFSFFMRFQAIIVVKMVFPTLVLRHKTGGSANKVLTTKKSILTAVKKRRQ